MKRRLRLIVMALCTLGFALTLVMWFRGHFVGDGWATSIRGPGSIAVSSRQGTIAIAGFRWHGARELEMSHRSRPVDQTPLFPIHLPDGQVMGFGWYDRPMSFIMDPVQEMPDGTKVDVFGAATMTLQGKMLVFPHWALVVLLAVVMGLLLVGPLRRRRRLRRGLCVGCGYDLRESQESCPECGTAILSPVARDRRDGWTDRERPG